MADAPRGQMKIAAEETSCAGVYAVTGREGEGAHSLDFGPFPGGL